MPPAQRHQTKPSAAVKTLLRAIAAGRSYRANHDTYDAAVKAGLAEYVSGAGWALTEAGRAYLEVR